jgi:hypothetical protein
VITGRRLGRDPFPEIPLLAGRLAILDDLTGLSSDDLDGLWMDVYKYRYLAALVVGDNRLARSRLDALREYHDRIASTRGQEPLDVNAERDWISGEHVGGGPERKVERVLDEDASLPDDFALEHMPVYSPGNLLLCVVGARVTLRRDFTWFGRLVTVREWRQARSERLHREISYRYYGSGALARDDISTYVLAQTLRDNVAAFHAAQR